MRIGKKILSEVFRGILLVIGVSLIAFLLITKAPIDPLISYIGTNSTLTQETKDEITRYWGLNDPLPERFGTWVNHAVHGDLGRASPTKSRSLT